MNVIPGPNASALAARTTAADHSTLWRRTAMASAAAALLAVGALASTLWQRQTPVAETAAAAEAVPAQASTLPVPVPVPVPVAADPSPTPAAKAQAPAQVAAAKPRSHPAAKTAPVEATRSTETTPLPTQPVAQATPATAPVCADCGVVEAVAAVTHPGEGTGIGAVAGGVLGGVLGHQIGGGNGRKALTVIGAIGGGLAGNQIEKHQRATTDYRVTVRMDDGTRRTLTQTQAPTVGQPVRVEGSRLLPAATSHPATPREGDREPGNLQTSMRG